LQELILYGLKGTAAYAEHAAVLGRELPDVYACIHECLDFLTKPNPSLDELLGWALRVGELNLQVMELLYEANTGTFGKQQPTPVRSRRSRASASWSPGTIWPTWPAAEADRGQGHQRLHARRDAALPRLSGTEEVPAPGGQLRRRVAGPEARVLAVSRRHPDDDQLHPEAQGDYQRPDLHQRPGGLAGRDAHRPGQGFHAR
jgi:hypothetical protein